MNEDELKLLEQSICMQLMHKLNMSKKAADFIINMTASFHSTRGGALYRISDYINGHEI